MHTFAVAVAVAVRLSCARFRGARVHGGAAAVVASLCVGLESPFAGDIQVGLDWVGSAQPVLRKFF